MMWRRRVRRRTVLRGLLGGAAVSVALPPLEAFLNNHGSAYASESAFPNRYVQFFWGNGIILDRWIPETAGEAWALSPLLSPLEPVRSDITLVTGLEVKVINLIAHSSGMVGYLTGSDLVPQGGGYDIQSPSLDQLIAQQIGGSTRFRSLEAAVEPGTRGLSMNGPGNRNPPEDRPAALFERLFGPEFRAPGEDPIIDPRLALRRSVLDAVMSDTRALSQTLGSADKRRLDQHLTSVRELELRIARLEEDPPNLASCVRPASPTEPAQIDGRVDLIGRSQVMIDLLVMAMACDQSRVCSYWFSDPVSNALFPGTSAGHHQLTHDEPAEQPQVFEITKQIIGQFGYFIEAMKGIPEGDGTLLDHAVLMATSDCSAGRTHQIDEYPILLAGTGGGRIKTGVHHRSETKDNASMVPFTLLKTFGANLPQYGLGDSAANSGLSAIEV